MMGRKPSNSIPAWMPRLQWKLLLRVRTSVFIIRMFLIDYKEDTIGGVKVSFRKLKIQLKEKGVRSKE
jgi:hypothetical protein